MVAKRILKTQHSPKYNRKKYIRYSLLTYILDKDFIANILTSLDYTLVQQLSQQATWENPCIHRRILLRQDLNLISYNRILLSGARREIASATMPVNSDELLKQLQALEWL